MPKLNEKGAVFFILIFVFVAVSIVAGMLIYKTFTQASKKITKDTEVLEVALKSDFKNPFEEEVQYENPFNEYHNPFDQI